MESNISSRSSSPAPETKPQVKPVKEKRPITDKQRESLRKGMEALKVKREALAKEKEERKKTNEELKAKGLPPIEPPLKIKNKDIMELPKLEPVELKIKTRKQRSDKGIPKKNPDPMLQPINRQEFAELRGLMATLRASVPTEVVKEKVVEKEVPVVKEKEVIREKVLTGSDLLNKIFFAK
jgi:hypothetical protein